MSHLILTITLGDRIYYYPCFVDEKTYDCFVDTVKIHNRGEKYNVYFYAIMYQTILTCLDYLRAISAAYSIFTTIRPLLVQFSGSFCIF